MQIKLQKNLVGSGEEYYYEIVKTFGEEILTSLHEIDRKKLAQIVFSSKKEKEKLDKITYKYVVPKIAEEAKKFEKFSLSVIDVPLLFESKLNEICDMTIGVIANKNVCVERITKRDNIDRKEAIARINSQNQEDFFKEKCNYCIFNINDKRTEYQIKEIFNRK